VKFISVSIHPFPVITMSNQASQGGAFEAPKTAKIGHHVVENFWKGAGFSSLAASR